MRQGPAPRANQLPDRHLGARAHHGGIIPEEKVPEVRTWIENYHRLKDRIEKISEINRELLRRQRAQQRKRKRKG